MNRKLFNLLLIFSALLWSSSTMHAAPVRSVQEQNQTFTFIDSGYRLPGLRSSVMAFGDLDSDGDLDYYENRDGYDRIWLNDGADQFVDSGKYVDDNDNIAYDVALVDLDGDKDLDLFVAHSYSNSIFFNDGQANFVKSNQSIKMASGSTHALGLADLDGDGDLDAYLGGGSLFDPDEVWTNNGSGFFTDSQQRLGSDTSYAVATGDVDSDQDIDVIVTTCGMFNEPDKLWLNDGAGNLTDSGQSFDNACTADLSLHDLNGDKHLDLIIDSAGADEGLLTIWLNDGAGHFHKSTTITTTGYALAGDLDGDQDIDILLSDGTTLLNDGSGGLITAMQTASGGSSLLDVDGDGDLDLIINTTTERQIWLNVSLTEVPRVLLPIAFR